MSKFYKNFLGEPKYWIIFSKTVKILKNILTKISKFAKKPANSCINLQKLQICKICADSLAHTKYALITFEFERSIPTS